MTDQQKIEIMDAVISLGESVIRNDTARTTIIKNRILYDMIENAEKPGIAGGMAYYATMRLVSGK